MCYKQKKKSIYYIPMITETLFSQINLCLRSSDLVKMTAQLHSLVHCCSQSLNAQQQIISISANDDNNRALIKTWCQRPVDEREPRQENTKWKIFMDPEKMSFVWWSKNTHILINNTTHTHFHLQALCCLVFSCILQKERNQILQTHSFIFYWYTVCVCVCVLAFESLTISLYEECVGCVSCPTLMRPRLDQTKWTHYLFIFLNVCFHYLEGKLHRRRAAKHKSISIGISP